MTAADDMTDFGLGKLRLWSAAAACAGLFMTQAAGAHPAVFTLNDVRDPAVYLGDKTRVSDLE
jgi:hypothetical protein